MNLRSIRSLALLLLLPLLLVACGADEPEGRDVIKPMASAAPEPQGAAPPMASQAGTGGDLQYQLPEGWTPEAPANSMRMAQARIPGDAGDGEFALFYFGPGGGGGVEANIQRWVGQVDDAQPERDTYQAGDLTVHTVVATGTLTGSPMSMQGGQPAPQEDSMLLGAVVEGPGGPWFFKATGPAATLEPYRDAFFDMVRNLSLGA
ncbi:MAG TPA: hypothetical protein VJG13_15145 [Thermoanaerobaculia bacterium]|nr:hypothetical protein [Thermoanaerobaculia bacterium]